MEKNLANKILVFFQTLDISIKMPDGVRAMNPYVESSDKVQGVIKTFYQKFYSDNKSRTLILGINPGRLGAGATGIPFTDTKRLNKECGIAFDDFHLHEPSSVFVYEMIEAYGGAEKFYADFYISSISPLGFVKQNEKGNELNFNYYDDKDFANRLESYIVSKIKAQISFGLKDVCVCWGTGKNFAHLSKLNEKYQLFKEVIPLEHPRYIVQYKSKEKDFYIKKYVDTLKALS